jgi:peptide/nickel transport system substrate-binding protein
MATPTPSGGDVPAFTPAGTAVAAYIGLSTEVIEPSLEPENTYSTYAGEMVEWFVDIDQNGLPTRELGVLEDWVMSPDGRKWTFTIRKGLRWHDGEPVTSADAVFTMERYGAPESVCSMCTSVQNNVSSTVAIDDYVWEMNFIEPDQFFPVVAMVPLQGDIPIMPKHHWEAVGGSAGFTANPMGSGPMKFVDRRIGEFIEFEANLDYWNRWRIPGFSVVRKIAVPEAGSRLTLVQTGDADLALMGPQNIQDIKDAGLAIMGPQDQWVTYISYCQGWDPAFASNNINVRKAITLALDREALSQIAYPGEGGTSIDWVHTPNQEGYLDTLEPYPFDPAQARQILEDEGLVGLEVIMPQYDFGIEPALPILQEAAAAMLEGVGFSPKLVPLDFASLIDNIQQGKLEGPVQLHPYLWSTASTFDSNLRILMLDRKDGGNIMCFPDREGLGTRFFNMIGELDRDKRIAIAEEANQWMRDIYGYIPITLKNEIWAAGPRVGEWLPSKGVPLYKQLHTLKPVGDARIGLDPFK